MVEIGPKILSKLPYSRSDRPSGAGPGSGSGNTPSPHRLGASPPVCMSWSDHHRAQSIASTHPSQHKAQPAHRTAPPVYTPSHPLASPRGHPTVSRSAFTSEYTAGCMPWLYLWSRGSVSERARVITMTASSGTVPQDQAWV